MPFDAQVRKTESPEKAIRDAKVSSYMGAKARLTNARRALHASIAEFERAVHEVEKTRAELDTFVEEHDCGLDLLAEDPEVPGGSEF